LSGIIDLTMWGFGFHLEQDYSVIHQFGTTGRNTIDFKLTCHNIVFLCEARNWNIPTKINKMTYDQKIKTRFFCSGINILMIRKDKVSAVEKMYQKYSTVNGQPINYIEIDNFMDVNRNDIHDINWNLLFGVNQMHNYVLRNIGKDRDFNLIECLQMGMPTWFISEYLKTSRKTVNRHSKKLGYNRKSSTYKKSVKYRDIN
jgi:hypothetical protein